MDLMNTFRFLRKYDIFAQPVYLRITRRNSKSGEQNTKFQTWQGLVSTCVTIDFMVVYFLYLIIRMMNYKDDTFRT